jgi:hypothetical protein
MRFTLRLLSGAILLFAASTGASATEATAGSIYLRAASGSYVGGELPQNGAIWVHSIDTVMRSYAAFDRGAHLYTNATPTSTCGWNFHFATPYSALSPQELITGHYSGATRHPFNSGTEPGLSVNGNCRGYNRSIGWFTVLEVSYDTSFDLVSFAADFAQYGLDQPDRPSELFGSIRFNSSIPLATNVPEPSTASLVVAGLVGLWAQRSRRSRGKAS